MLVMMFEGLVLQFFLVKMAQIYQEIMMFLIFLILIKVLIYCHIIIGYFQNSKVKLSMRMKNL